MENTFFKCGDHPSYGGAVARGRQEDFCAAVAADIQEGLSQQLIGALLHLQAYVQLQKMSPAQSQDSFEIGVKMIQESLGESQRIARRLRPETFDDRDAVNQSIWLPAKAPLREDTTTLASDEVKR